MNTISKVSIIITVAIVLTAFVMYTYYEYKYDLSFSVKYCRSIGFVDFGGVAYIGFPDGSMSVDGVECIDKEGVHHVVREAVPFP